VNFNDSIASLLTTLGQQKNPNKGFILNYLKKQQLKGVDQVRNVALIKKIKAMNDINEILILIGEYI